MTVPVPTAPLVPQNTRRLPTRLPFRPMGRRFFAPCGSAVRCLQQYPPDPSLRSGTPAFRPASASAFVPTLRSAAFLAPPRPLRAPAYLSSPCPPHAPNEGPHAPEALLPHRQPTKNPPSVEDGFHTQTLTIQTMQWLNFLLFVLDTKVGQNNAPDNRHK